MARNKKIKKPRYAGGGDFYDKLAQYGGPIGSLTKGAFDTAFPQDEFGVRSDAASFGSGALGGAVAGAAFGPIGAGAGALVGGITGLMGNSKAKDRKKTEEMRRAFTTNQMLLNNQGVQLAAKGGKLATLASNAKGGSLKRISPDAVEVDANDPSQTDSVDVGDALVDNKEIIDNTGRVFSEDRKSPSGRSYAREAKKLEKMKSKSSRFNMANGMIDAKLNKLFEHQEATNTDKLSKGGMIRKKKYANGGSYFVDEPDPNKPAPKSPREHLDIALAKNYPGRALEELDDHLVPVQPGIPDTPSMSALRRGYRPSMQIQSQLPLAGKQLMSQSAPDVNKMILDKTAGMKKGGRITKGAYDFGGTIATAGQSIGRKIKPGNWGATTNEDLFGDGNEPKDYSKGITNLATYAPNLINMGLNNQLPSAPTPNLESRTNFQRVNANDQLAANSRHSIQAGKQITNNTAQAGNAASNLGAVLSRRLAADNDVHGSTNRQNAQIQMNEAFINQGIGARNTERLNLQKMQNVQRKTMQLSSLSSNVSNIGEKTLMQGRERNMMDRDMMELDVLKKAYGDSGVYGRNFDKIIDEYVKRKGMKARGNSRGGRIKFYDKLFRLG